MKRYAYKLLILTMAIFLVTPLSNEARGGHGVDWSGGGHGAWRAALAILGGAAILSSITRSSRAEPSVVVIPEQPPVRTRSAKSVTLSSPKEIFVYPRLGQSEELQAKDRYECHRWAARQTHYDPTWPPPVGDMPQARRNQMYVDYRRAENSCLDSRGYTVK
jgi:hypothetical protein